MKKNLVSLFFVSTLLFTFASCSNTGSTNHVEKDFYDFCFNVNYEGGANRVDCIAKGKTAPKWDAKRKGYLIENWYTDRSLKTPYNFSTPVNNDTTVYAKWIEKGDGQGVVVTFDFNYKDGPNQEKISLMSGYKIAINNVPTVSRFGYISTGWYTEPECKNKWSFLNDEVNSNITLYAGYEEDKSLEKDSNGKILFNNVSIDFAPNILSWGLDGFGHDEVDKMVKEFNKRYSGKIIVNKVSINTTENVTLEDTGMINEKKNDYYNAEEILKAVDIDFSEEEYYSEAISENYIAGKLKSIPFGHMVPFICYNKNVLNSLGYSKFPTTHDEIYELLVKANEVNKNNPNWKGALAQPDSWTMFEIGSHAIWSNSGLSFLKYNNENNSYTNVFKDSKNYNSIKNAIIGGNRIFGYDSLVNSGYNSVTSNDVSDGNSLMMYTAFYTQFTNIRTRYNNKNGVSLTDKEFFSRFGIAPATELCDFGNTKDSKIFAKGLSFGIKNNALSLNQVAASAVFADWMSHNSAKIMGKYVYPANRTVQNSDDFVNGEFESKVLRSGVDPSKVITMAGHKMNYKIYNYFNSSCLDTIRPLAPETIKDDTIETMIQAFAEALDSYIKEE